MKLKSVKVDIKDLDQIVNFVADKVKFVYENHSKDMSILINESFHLRSMSGQLDMVIFKIQNNCINVDILAGGGGEGVLNLDLWSEDSFVSSVINVLDEFAKTMNVDIELIEN